jgi:hypothetical protein
VVTAVERLREQPATGRPARTARQSTTAARKAADLGDFTEASFVFMVGILFNSLDGASFSDNLADLKRLSDGATVV